MPSQPNSQRILVKVQPGLQGQPTLALDAGTVPSLSMPWLFGVARHKLADHWRRLAREDAKLALVAILVAHHVWLGKLMLDFRRDRNRHSHVFYRWINEIPALPVLLGAVLLVVFKPF